jgi:hypothetical protein
MYLPGGGIARCFDEGVNARSAFNAACLPIHPGRHQSDISGERGERMKKDLSSIQKGGEASITDSFISSGLIAATHHFGAPPLAVSRIDIYLYTMEKYSNISFRLF